MRDFDVNRKAHAARDRTFRIGGEVFTVVASARPEELDAVSSIPADSPEYLPALDDTIARLLEDDGGLRWAALRERGDHDAISLADVNDVFGFCMQAVTGRPPTPPKLSSPLPATPSHGTFSTVGSSAQAVEVPDTSTLES